MKNFIQYVQDRGIEVPNGVIDGAWFSKHGYP